MKTVAVLGAGAWGTALAAIAVQAGNRVRLWARNADTADAIAHRQANPGYLPDVPLPAGIDAGTDPRHTVAEADTVLVVTPAQAMRDVLDRLRGDLPAGIPLVVCAKGIEKGSLRPTTEVAADIFPDHPVAVLSGPTFAREAALGMPTLAVVACRDLPVAEDLCRMLATPTFRPYASDDVVAVCLAGAVKNVLAIACGVVAGKEMGDNAKAALITRGLAEMRRLVVALGGRGETVDGLSGLGDLVLTAGSLQSRNMSLGDALGRGQSLDAVLAARHSVTEGVWTASALLELAARNGVEMPICAAVDGIINGGQSVDDSIRALLARPLRRE